MASAPTVDRQSIRLPDYDYRGNGAYFITICASQRRMFFTDQRIAEIIRECWDGIPEHFADVYTDAFVVMPNHVHGIVWILQNGVPKVPERQVVGARHASPLQRPRAARGVESGSLGAIVGSFKSAVRKRVSEIGGPSPLWQRNYYERVIRNERELGQIREYISLNSVKWHLDRENPTRVVDAAYDGEWGWLEGDLVA